MSVSLDAVDPSAKIAIKAESLTKIYGADNTEVVAMRDASMTVMAGEVVSLLGPSGSGKSPLVKSLHCSAPAALASRPSLPQSVLSMHRQTARSISRIN